MPQFILVSAGFDGHYTDPVASLSLSASAYLEAFAKTLNLASQFCRGKLVAVLEGGYSLVFLGKIVAAAIGRMAGVSYVIREKPPVAANGVRKEVEKIVAEVKRVQSSFWDL